MKVLDHELSHQDIIELYMQSVFEKTMRGEMSIGDIEKETKELREVGTHAYRNRKEYEPKEYVSKEFASECYRNILESEEHYNEILKIAAGKYDKDADWLKVVKHRKFFYSKEIVDDFSEHPKQVGMTKRGTFRKKEIRESNTVNQLLKGVASQRDLDNLVLKLSEDLNKLKQDNEDLSAKTESNSFDVERINQHLQLSPADKREKAMYLKSKGFTYKVIARELGVNRKTLTRWFKNVP